MKPKKLITYKLIPRFTTIITRYLVATVERANEIEYVKTYSCSKQELNSVYGTTHGRYIENISDLYDFVTITTQTDRYRILVYDTRNESIIRRIDVDGYDNMCYIIQSLKGVC